jgi:hypothetical protein
VRTRRVSLTFREVLFPHKWPKKYEGWRMKY